MNGTPEAAVLTLNAMLAIALAWFGEAPLGTTLSYVAACFLGGALAGHLGTRIRAKWTVGRYSEAVPSSLEHRLDGALPIMHAVVVLAFAALTLSRGCRGIGRDLRGRCLVEPTAGFHRP